MRLGQLEVTFHRTVRVPNGRVPSNLPPSLGRMQLHKVSDYRTRCPKSWDSEAYFMALHDVEAMWMAFHATSGVPCAILIGAGGINALTGAKLGTKLAKGNYVVAPPQPWLDGWKDKDGTVYQFIATPYQKGKGLSVGEQILKKDAKTGAIGIAVFDPKNPRKLATTTSSPHEFMIPTLSSAVPIMDSCYAMGPTMMSSKALAASSSHHGKILRSASVAEMGIGKGGKITQKVYPDPYGLSVWKTTPSAVFAVYLVDAASAAAITGETVAAPASHEAYTGAWFGLGDQQMADVEGSEIFTGLKSPAFPGDTSNAHAKTGKGKHQATA